MNTTSLHNFVSYECLMFYMKSENCINIDYTYCGPNQSISVIDHFIISDHEPVFLDVEWPSPISTNISDTITYHIPIPLWARATQAQIIIIIIYI